MRAAHRPFHAGSQYLDWTEANCRRCTKGHDELGNPDAVIACPIEAALSEASWNNGTVTHDIAKRMGYLDHSPPRLPGFAYVWRCGEFTERGPA